MGAKYFVGTCGFHYDHWGERVGEVYSYFNNDVEGFALGNAKTLVKLLERASQ